MILQAERFDEFLSELSELPDGISPLRFSSDENATRAGDLVSDRNRFGKFVREEASGFFLYASRATYSFRRVSPDAYVANISGISSIESRFLLSSLAVFSCFAFACESGEYEHRNLLSKSAAYGQHEVWVGRDWKKYIPGLYWMVLISEALAEAHGISIDLLKSNAVELEQPAPGMWILKFFDRAESWRENARRIDSLIASMDGIFSIEMARNEFASAGNFIEASNVARRWP
jgi:hypothetical protein